MKAQPKVESKEVKSECSLVHITQNDGPNDDITQIRRQHWQMESHEPTIYNNVSARKEYTGARVLPHLG